jgi:hypothetical protein
LVSVAPAAENSDASEDTQSSVVRCCCFFRDDWGARALTGVLVGVAAAAAGDAADEAEELVLELRCKLRHGVRSRKKGPSSLLDDLLDKRVAPAADHGPRLYIGPRLPLLLVVVD